MQGPSGRYTIVFNREIYNFHVARHSIESIAFAWMFGGMIERPARATTLGGTQTVGDSPRPEEYRAR